MNSLFILLLGLVNW